VTRSKSGLLLTQAGYAADVLKKAHMSNCKSVSTPLTPSDKLMINDGAALGPRDSTEYKYRGRTSILDLDEAGPVLLIEQGMPVFALS
jgi:hypothetical protein